MRWYALRTLGGREFAVARDLACLGYEPYVPITWKWRRYRAAGKSRDVPRKAAKIAGYVFLELDRLPADIRTAVRGVVGFVGIGREPVPIPREQIEALRMLSEDRKPLRRPLRRRAALGEGQAVRIVDGPFAGYRTSVAAVVAQGQYMALVDLLGKSHAIQFSDEQLEPA